MKSFQWKYNVSTELHIKVKIITWYWYHNKLSIHGDQSISPCLRNSCLCLPWTSGLTQGNEHQGNMVLICTVFMFKLIKEDGMREIITNPFQGAIKLWGGKMLRFSTTHKGSQTSTCMMHHNLWASFCQKECALSTEQCIKGDYTLYHILESRSSKM